MLYAAYEGGNAMANMIDYVLWRGDIPVSQVPLGPIDALILSYLSYMPYDGLVDAGFEGGGMTLAQAAGYFLDKGCRSLNLMDCDRDDRTLLEAIENSERFGTMTLTGYENHVDAEQEKQFAALVFLPPEGPAFISFRGTDSTVIGWKEDFNMSFTAAVPAQLYATRYAERAARALRRKLILGGHSKGGNLAAYAGIFADAAARAQILCAYNFDGPGFNEAAMASPAFGQSSTRIHTYVPQSSIIGILLWHAEPFTVVKSEGIGVLQHNPYTWQLMGGSFITLDGLSGASRFADATLKGWLEELAPQERRQVIDGIYEVISASEGESVASLFEPRNLLAIVRAAGDMEEEKKRRILDAFRLLGASVVEAVPGLVGNAAGELIARVRGELPPGEKKETQEENGGA